MNIEVYDDGNPVFYDINEIKEKSQDNGIPESLGSKSIIPDDVDKSRIAEPSSPQYGDSMDDGIKYSIGENDADMDIMSYIENFGRESLDALIDEVDRNDAKANQEMQEHMEAQGRLDLDALIDETDTRRAVNDRMMKQRTEFLAEANRELNPNVEEYGTLGITDKDIENLLSRNGVSEKTFANIESIRSTMVENVDKWVPNADVIKAKYGGAFTKRTLDTAIYEAFAYGDVEPDTRSRMREHRLNLKRRLRRSQVHTTPASGNTTGCQKA